MIRIPGLTILLVAVALSVACSQAPTEKAAKETVPAATSTDPTVVDATHYRNEFENDRVRVLRVHYGPGEESAMHEHPDHVAIMLADAHGEMRTPDGTVQDFHGAAGSHMLAPAGSHSMKNTSDQDWNVVLVELKPGASAESEGGEPGPDPTVVDAAHYRAEFENDRVRVLRIKYGPGEESVMHHHPDGVAVFLTDHHVEFTMPDGSKADVHKKAGESLFVSAGPHLPKNVGSEPVELLLVELK